MIAIEKLPAEYQPVLTAKMRKEGSLLSASHIENTPFQYWHSVHGLHAKNLVTDAAKKQDSESGIEVALAALNGTCNRCGHRGHKGAECYDKKHINRQTLTQKAGGGQGSNSNQGNKKDNNNNNMNSNQEKKCFQGDCNYCSKFGHKEADCHKKAADQQNGLNEAAAVAVSNGINVKFLLCAIAEYGMMATTKQVFPNSHKLLTQPTICIGDMAATMDMTLCVIGMINKKEAKESVSIMMRNKQVEKLVTIGDIPSMMCDNQGNQVMGALMKDITLVPDSRFNLFSISKHLKKGWKLGGTEDALILMS